MDKEGLGPSLIQLVNKREEVYIYASIDIVGMDICMYLHTCVLCMDDVLCMDGCLLGGEIKVCW